MPDGCPLGARSVPSATGSGSSTTEFVPRPTCIDPASRRIRCPAWLSAGLCPSSSKPCGIEGSRRPCPRAASRASCAGVHDGACGSERWRLRLAPKPWSRGRWRPSGSPRAGCRFGRPQRGASSPICLYPSDSLRSFGPPGAATLDESKDARSQSISSALPKRSKSLRCSRSHTLLATPRGVANTPAPRRRGARFPTPGRASIRGRLEAYLGRGGLQRPSPLRLAQAAAQPSASGGLREVAPGAPLRRGPRRAHRLHGLLRRGDDARDSGKGGRQPLAGWRSASRRRRGRWAWPTTR